MDPAVAGRWSTLPEPEGDLTARASLLADQLLARHGVLTRGAAASENVPGGFATLYKVLTTLEEAGRCQRGYFVETLGGAQFSSASTVDRLRGFADPLEPQPTREPTALVLAATDPANPYGAALGWPARSGGDEEPGHRPGRRAGALVVLVDGKLVWFLERGGKTLLGFTDVPDLLTAAAGALVQLVRDGRIAGLLVERIDGMPALDPRAGAGAQALQAAGFARTPRGLRLRR